ncbi:[protein-PII] uridylyltransferase [Psychromonas sp. CNPT3]|uniref:[protein-PII] uridylyltransferase n=1 Tax=Psychromonas sp. CNPT3 TaxID=314282 RepID=UPI0002F9BD0F|nr:[protein-PII] uridylyltransferase [Psychromonas sp. CNPT3]
MHLGPFSPSKIEHNNLTLSFLKKHHQEFHQWQVARFKKNENINYLVHQRALYIDLLLARLWQFMGLDKCYRLSLLAVGGYGRAELHPKSDIDILILSVHGFTTDEEQKITAFITFLWDLKFDIGHSVRDLDDCFNRGKEDLSIATSMLEARHIQGNKKTLKKLQQLLQRDDFWPSEKFFLLKREEQRARHKNCRGDGYSLEPDLKNGRGGLRDIQTIVWVAKRHFGVSSLLKLTRYHYITKSEYYELVDCQTLLWRVRFALHCVTGRADNRLLFDFQGEVASLLGYQGARGKAIETMMKEFYQTIHHIKELNEMLLQYFDEAINDKNSTKIIPIDAHFQCREQMIELKTTGLFKTHPHTILQLFLYIASDDSIVGVYSSTLRALREARRHLKQWLQELPECRRLFMSIIKHPQGMGRAFTLMHEYGVLGAYIPQWSRIVGQMQFDLFHAYTVDEHTHKLLKYIYNYPQTKALHPLAHDIYRYLEKPELLFLGAIFHDIAKGQNGDHSALGAVDAYQFCQLHQLNHADSTFVAWLVEQHLTLSVTAQRRDISDPGVIRKFAKIVQDETHLNYLYCLTVADICATNEGTWNSWKGSLLRDLYSSTQKMLRRGIDSPRNLRQRIKNRKQKTLDLLAQTGTDTDAVKNLWKNFKLDYFFRYRSAQIAWHTRALLGAYNKMQPLVLISTSAQKDATEIFVYHRDAPSIFSSVVTEIDNKRLSVYDAKILSSRDAYTLSTFSVLELDGKHISGDKIQRLKKAIEVALMNPAKVNCQQKQLIRIKRQFKIEPLITFLPTRRKRTQIEVVAFDAPGILANIGKVFRKLDLMLYTAKITTIGARVEDLFIISTKAGEALTPVQEKELQEHLILELSPDKNA